MVVEFVLPAQRDIRAFAYPAVILGMDTRKPLSVMSETGCIIKRVRPLPWGEGLEFPHLPSPWGRGWPAAGVLFSRSGPGEGLFRPPV